MNLRHDPKKPLLFRVPMLPTWGFANSLIQGERWTRTKIWEAEHQRWIGLLLQAGMRQRETPLFPGRCTVEATFFRHPRGGEPDQMDNMFLAMKPLWDVIEVWRVIESKKRDGAVSRHARGHFGIVSNDRLLRWGNVPEMVATRDYGRDGLSQFIITPRE